MGFRNNAYAKVWEVKVSQPKYTDIRISISRKLANGKYEQDFSGYVRLIGDAHQKASDLNEGDRIKILSADVSSTYSKEKNVTYYSFKVFDFENADGSASAPSGEFFNVAEEDDDELPFG